MTTPLTQTADVVNRIIALTAQLHDIKRQVDDAAGQWTNISAANNLANFPTAPLLTTGELGTADVAPNVAHVVDTRVAGTGALISRAVSANDVAGMLGVLQGISTAIGGGAVSANGAAVQLIAKTL